MVSAGAWTDEQAARSNAAATLSSAIGGSEIMPVVGLVDLEPGDTLMLCTDGLNKHVGDDHIEAARYLAYGCPPTLVCGSVLTELVIGKTVEEAKKLVRADLLNAIGGLPSRKHHAASLAIETLHSALDL